MGVRVYLDWNATTPLRPEARAAMIAAMDSVGNPSSVHSEGRAARQLIEEARERVAGFMGASPRNVIFTSSGTEANALALTPALRAGTKPRDRLLISAIEHPSVLNGGRFARRAVEEVPVTSQGVIDLPALRRRLSVLRSGGISTLVSIMQANNETGVIQPIAAAAAVVQETGGLLHVDAVQAAGKISCCVNDLNADLVTVSGHKIGGPTGVGALVMRADGLPIGEPLIKGGAQERGSRAGTENVAGIAGFGAAALAAQSGSAQETQHMVTLRDRLETELRASAKDLVIFGADADRLPNTSLFAVPGVKAETAVIALDLDGIAVSSGSACSSGKVTLSHVLAAMGVPATLAAGAVRVSLGRTTTEQEIDIFLRAWRKHFAGLSKERSGLAA